MREQITPSNLSSTGPYLSLLGFSRMSAAGLKCGFSADAVLHAAGMRVDVTKGTGHDLDLKSVLALFDAAITAGSKDYFPLVLPDHFSFDFLPELETFLSTSPNLDTAMKILDWLPALLVREFEFSVVNLGNNIALKFSLHQADKSLAANGLAETVLLVAEKFVRKLLPEVTELQAHFSHAPQVSAVRYRQAFIHPPLFNQAFTCLSMPATGLNAPIAQGSSQLNALMALAMENSLRNLQQLSSWSERLMSILQKQPECSMEVVASQLDVPVRSLQRKLHSEGTTFQALQMKALLALAEAYLRQPDLDIESISIKLGFSDRHSFSRAFKRWTGHTPSSWRSNHLGRI